MKFQILLTPLSLWVATGSSCATYGGICHQSSLSRMNVAIRARTDAKERLDKLLPYVRSTRMIAAHMDELEKQIAHRSSLTADLESSVGILKSQLKELNGKLDSLNSELEKVESLIRSDWSKIEEIKRETIKLQEEIDNHPYWRIVPRYKVYDNWELQRQVQEMNRLQYSKVRNLSPTPPSENSQP